MESTEPCETSASPPRSSSIATATRRINLGRIRDLTRRAAAQGAEIVCFHECSVTAYTFLQTLSRDELDALAEPVPDGPSIAALDRHRARVGRRGHGRLDRTGAGRPALQDVT